MRQVATSLMTLAVALGWTAENRFILVNQSDFGAKRGFYVSFENSGNREPLSIETGRLILAVADGRTWKFVDSAVKLQVGRTYRVVATLGGGHNELKVDGTSAAASDIGLSPLASPMEFGATPAWASSRASYRFELSGTSLTIGDRKLQIPDSAAVPAALRGFEAARAVTQTVSIPANETVTFTTSLRIDSVEASIPNGIIDPYGQAVPAEFPGKVKSDDDILASIREESNHFPRETASPRLDRFGGTPNADFGERGSGYFRTVKREQKWWLVTPDGNPIFYTGMCTAPALVWDKTPVTGREGLWQSLPPRDGVTEKLWAPAAWGDAGTEYVATHSWNLVRKFGSDWEAGAKNELTRRLRQWGFSGMGKWCDPIAGVPDFPVLGLAEVPKLGRHPDVFDPKIRQSIETVLRRQIEPRRLDPFVVGWSIGNEYDEIITTDEIRTLLAGHGESPAAAALKKFLGMGKASSVDEESLESARQFYAKAYYKCLYDTVKSIDPNHLYFGFWIVPGWWQNDSDWDLIEPYCDVIGYDRYADTYEGVAPYVARHDKPTLLGEFSYPAWYGGKRGFGRYASTSTESDEESGDRYAALMKAASADPRCVGTLWFQYRDQPLTGRGPGIGPSPVHGEHYAFGFVDLTDRPKWGLVDRARRANLTVTHDRLAGKR